MSKTHDVESERQDALIDRPQSYEEMAARPAFRAVLDNKQHELASVLSDYRFSRLVPCGLRSCRKQHRDGLLVQTKDGLETNLGHVCGKRTFGDSFVVARAAYRRKRDRDDLMRRAFDIRGRDEEIRSRIAELNRGRYGIKWVQEVRGALRALLGTDLYESLSAVERRGDYQVQEVRERSAAEIEQITAATAQKREQVRYQTEVLGMLEPMSCFVFNFEARLRVGILVPLEELKALDVGKTPSPRLRTTVKKFDGWEEAIREAEEAASSAIRVLSRENLALLVKWIPARMVSRRRSLAEWIGSKPHRQLLGET